LKNMKFEDKTLEELISAGDAPGLAECFSAISQFIDSYRSAMSVALARNPELAKDDVVSDANNASGTFAYAIKLMPAPEMPNSVASAQQTSAEAARTPEEWKDLSNRHVDRLLQSVEAGMQKALSAIDQAQQEMDQQNDERGQEIAEAGLQDADM